MTKAPLVVTGPGGDFVNRYYPHDRGLFRAQGWRRGAGAAHGEACVPADQSDRARRGRALSLGPELGRTG